MSFVFLGTLSVFIERKERWGEITLYVLANFLESSAYDLRK